MMMPSTLNDYLSTSQAFTCSAQESTTSAIPSLPPEILFRIIEYAILPSKKDQKIFQSLIGTLSANSVFRTIALSVWFGEEFKIRAGGDRERLVGLLGEGRMGCVKTVRISIPLPSSSPFTSLPALHTLIFTGLPSPELINVPHLFSVLPKTVTTLQLPVTSFKSIGNLATLPPTPQIKTLKLVLEHGDYASRQVVLFPCPYPYVDVEELVHALYDSFLPFPSLQSLTLPHQLVPNNAANFYLTQCNTNVCIKNGWCTPCRSSFHSYSSQAEIRGTETLARLFPSLMSVSWGYWFFVRGVGASEGSEVVIVRDRMTGEVVGTRRRREEEERLWEE